MGPKLTMWKRLGGVRIRRFKEKQLAAKLRDERDKVSSLTHPLKKLRNTLACGVLQQHAPLVDRTEYEALRPAQSNHVVEGAPEQAGKIHRPALGGYARVVGWALLPFGV